jgi:hypothetical protein
LFRDSRTVERREKADDDAVGIMSALLCPEYKDLKTRFGSAEERYAQYSDKRNRDVIGAYSERARNIRREARANMILLSQRMCDHRANCLICRNETKGQRSA